ncbi:MAG: HD domain-containing protein [Gammaproteobacteria bacterium]
MENKSYLRNYLIDLLSDLEFIQESSPYHPEENVLIHSLQVFELAYHDSNDPELRAAALLHDVGKAVDLPHHAEIGANLLKNVLSPRIVWLVEHHLDLLSQPKKTRHLLRNQPQLLDLERLRRWDLQGRIPDKSVVRLAFAVDCLLQFYPQITGQNADPVYLTEGWPTSH